MRKLRMIERVIEFATELQAAPFHGQPTFQYLRNGNIDVRLSGASCYSRAAIPKTSPRSIGADHRMCRKARVVEIVPSFELI